MLDVSCKCPILSAKCWLNITAVPFLDFRDMEAKTDKNKMGLLMDSQL